jgi:hypothetical protein
MGCDGVLWDVLAHRVMRCSMWDMKAHCGLLWFRARCGGSWSEVVAQCTYVLAVMASVGCEGAQCGTWWPDLGCRCSCWDTVAQCVYGGSLRDVLTHVVTHCSDVVASYKMWWLNVGCSCSLPHCEM